VPSVNTTALAGREEFLELRPERLGRVIEDRP
jgi:hypothetical protein